MSRLDFINKYADWVISSTFGTGIFPSVKMAQMIIESGNSAGIAGESSLAKKYNNYFGIKADSSWKGKSVNLATGEYFNKKKQQSWTVSECTTVQWQASTTIQSFCGSLTGTPTICRQKHPKNKQINYKHPDMQLHPITQALL